MDLIQNLKGLCARGKNVDEQSSGCRARVSHRGGRKSVELPEGQSVSVSGQDGPCPLSGVLWNSNIDSQNRESSHLKSIQVALQYNEHIFK